jgi:hypothetical protein
MNGRQFAQLGLGLTGVWALMSAINTFAAVAQGLAPGAGGSPGTVILVVGLPALLQLGLSYVLVFHNSSLARVIAPAADAVADRAGADLPRVLVALLGAMIVLQSLPRFVNLVLNIFAAAGDPDAMPGGGLRRALIASALELAFALYLVVRPERFLAFLDRPRAEPVESAAV